ncbi:MAG: tetratricopeptide repeat protein [Bacteroidota bacterium]
MFKSPLVILLFFGLCPIVTAQVDSLNALLPKASGKTAVDLLNEIATAALPEGGIEKAEEARHLAQQINYIEGEADANYILAKYFFMDHSSAKSPQKGLEYFRQAAQLYAKVQLDSAQIVALKGMLRTHYYMDQFSESLEDAIAIEEVAVRSGDSGAQAYAYVHHGRIYGRIMDQFEQSRHFLLKAKNIYEKLGDTASLGGIYNDLGSNYFRSENYDSAQYYYQQGFKIAETLDQSYEQAILKLNIAATYIKKEEYTPARQYIEALLQSPNPEQFPILYTSALIHMGHTYYEEKDFEPALHYLQRGIASAEEHKYYNQLSNGYEFLKDLYKDKGEYAKALELADQQLAIKDTINKHHNIEQLAQTKSAYELSEKQKEIVFLEKQTNMQKQISRAILLGGVMLTFFLLLLFNLSTLRSRLQKRKLESMQAKSELEKQEKLRLEEQLAHKERELASQTVFIIQKNKLLNQLKEQIKNLHAITNENASQNLKDISRTINQNMNFDDDWQRFKLHFDEVHPHFFAKLQEQFPHLNNNERRFCAYIRMGLATKEIAQLQGINASSVQKSRYRIKKKMGLEKNLKLVDFIAHF